MWCEGHIILYINVAPIYYEYFVPGIYIFYFLVKNLRTVVARGNIKTGRIVQNINEK